MREPIVIIGGGAAGLAVARELGRLRVPYRLLERGHTVGQTWHDLYDSLRLHTGRHLSALPGMRMPRGTSLFPSRLDYHAYLRAYAQRFGIVTELGREVTAVRFISSTDSGWEVVADGETIAASGIVVASGIVANPFIPQFPGRESFRGVVLHSADYSRPDTFAGMRVLVIGVGNSGGEIGSELARAGVDVTVAVRSGANVVPLTLGGIPIQYLATLVRKLPRRAQERIVELIRAA